jgi:hypothetical protein
MKNILGTTENLQLFGSSGEKRYDYWSNGQTIVETYYKENGEIEKHKTVKINNN